MQKKYGLTALLIANAFSVLAQQKQKDSLPLQAATYNVTDVVQKVFPQLKNTQKRAEMPQDNMFGILLQDRENANPPAAYLMGYDRNTNFDLEANEITAIQFIQKDPIDTTGFNLVILSKRNDTAYTVLVAENASGRFPTKKNNATEIDSSGHIKHFPKDQIFLFQTTKTLSDGLNLIRNTVFKTLEADHRLPVDNRKYQKKLVP